jgi:long-subunit fatty acid transport protein
MKSKLLLALILTIVSGFSLKAQYIEDALRVALPNAMITPRVANMGVSYYGLVDDIGALLYNPAGMNLVRKNELSFGLGFTRNSSETDYLDVKNLLNTNDEYITHAGIIVPFDMTESKAYIGIGYFMESNFENYIDFGAFNPTNSYISDYQNPNVKPQNKEDNLMYQLFLTDTFGIISPITDSLAQKGKISETGGIHNFTGAISFDISDNVSLGGAIIGKWGTYGYTRIYTESDIYNKYNFNDDVNWTNIDLTSFSIDERLSQEISGITGSIGIMGKIENFMRVSASIKFPTFYEITETFSQEGSVKFDNPRPAFNNTNTRTYSYSGETSYKIQTPFVFAGGISLHAAGLTFTAGVEYTDVTQLEFSDGTDYVMSLNESIIRDLVGQTTWGFGLEYKLPWIPVEVRTSYSSTTSPYSKDIPNASVKYFALGGGVYLASNVRLDGVFRWVDHSELRTNYLSGLNSYTLTNQPLNIGFQITYRY